MGGTTGTGGDHVVPDGLAGERADRILAVLAGVSRAESRALFAAGSVLADGRPVSGRDRLAAGTRLSAPPPPPPEALAPEPVPFTVRYDHDGVAVVDKPAGVVVHPGAGRRTGTLAAGLLHRWPEVEGVGEPGRWGIVHRLDRETSGLLVIGKAADTHRLLRAQVARREVTRVYLALVAGVMAVPTGTVDAPVGRDPHRPTRMAVQRSGRPARTHYRVLRSRAPAGPTLVEVTLETGRTHQIRVHLASIGHPLIGDRVYGSGVGGPGDPGRVWLHASALAFTHPRSGEAVEVTSPLPPELEATLALFDGP